jgi:hypothetical protein
MKRLFACLSAALLAAVASVLGPVPAAQAATQRVTADDLGAGRAWIRLRDDPATTRHPGVEEIAPLAAPDRFDGSLHLSTGPGQQAQAAHFFTSPVPLRTLLGSEISYDSYVDGAYTTATRTGAALQLPMVCDGTFTVLGFQPQVATDGQGRAGVVPDVWQHWNAGRDAVWRTSRAIAGFGAGQDAPLGDFADACGDAGGVVGLIANAAGPGAPAATLDTYADNLTLGGTTYDFAVAGTATAHAALHHDRAVTTGRRLTGTATFHSPANGPSFRGVGARIVLDDNGDADPGDVRVTADGKALKVTRAPGGSLVAQTPAALAAELRPGGTFTVPFTITLPAGPNGNGDGNGASLSATAELLANGFAPLQNTGAHDRATITF